MISLEDMVALSGLTEAEILAVAEHEHIPEACACGLASYLARQPRGSEIIRQMILEDIRDAQKRGDRAHVLQLLHLLHHFFRAHPDSRPRVHPWSSIF